MITFTRKHIQRLVLVALVCFAAVVHADEPAPSLLAGKRVLWLGDSITQDGKFVSFVEYYLEKQFPEQNFDFISLGLASETVSGLSEKAHPFLRPCVFDRLQRALDLTKPATVIACYGMNDGIYHPQSAERMKAFQEGIRRLSGAVQGSGAQLILLTPPPFDPLPVVARLRPADAPDFSYRAPYTNYDDVLGDYAKWEMSLPVDEVKVAVDLHSALSKYIAAQREKSPRFGFAKDSIHPSPAGHLLMALTFLNAVGVKIEVADLAAEVARLNADPWFQLIRQRRERRAGGWLDYVGYTRDRTVKRDSVDQTEKIIAAMQEKIDDLRKSPTIPENIK